MWKDKSLARFPFKTLGCFPLLGLQCSKERSITGLPLTRASKLQTHKVLLKKKKLFGFPAASLRRLFQEGVIAVTKEIQSVFEEEPVCSKGKGWLFKLTTLYADLGACVLKVGWVIGPLLLFKLNSWRAESKGNRLWP